MTKFIIFIVLLNLTIFGYSQTSNVYDRYMYPTLTVNGGITWTTTDNLRHSPMISAGINIQRFMVEYNTDRFTRYIDDYTIQQINLGILFGFNNRNYNNRHNRDYITLFGGRYWESVDNTNNLLQDKYVVGLRINSDIRNSYHLWGKIDSNLNIGIGVGIKLIDTNPMKRVGIKTF